MTKVIAHRGSKGTHPENTLVAFQEAIDCRCDGIELDIQYTKDNQLVVIHDNTVDRTTNSHGEITDFTLVELQKLDAGSWFDEGYASQRIPSFSEVLSLLESQGFSGLLNIEIKTDEKDYPGIEREVAAVMQRQSWDFEYVYSSFNLRSLELVHQFDPNAPKAYIMATSAQKIKHARTLDFITAIHPKLDWVKSQGDRIRSYPKAVRPWTVNDEVDMHYCFRHQLTGIHTDYPREAIRYRALMSPNVS